jgi:GAF domain-containing protein
MTEDGAVVGLELDAERLRHLQLVTDAALAHLDLDRLLATLLVRARDILNVDTCAVLLLDESSNELVARAAVGIEEEIEQGVRIPVGRGFAGTVAAQRQPVILPDVDHADVLNPLLRQKGIKSMVGVPLLVEGEVLGVLHVGALRHRTFTPEDVELLQLVADRAAIAIDHARAFEAERTARRRIEQVQSLTDVALAYLEVDELLSVLLPRIREILSVDTCAVLLLDEERGELAARAAVGIEEEVEQGVRIPLGRGFAGTVAAERRPVILDDVDHADVLNPLLREKGIKSLLGVPLLVRGEAIGVLHIGTLEPRAFGSEDVELLQIAADRAAIAIEHARLYESEHAARLRIEHVQAITDVALAHLGVNELLELLLPRIRDILAADTCAVLLVDPSANELVARAAVGIEEEVEAGVRIPMGGGFAGRVAATREPVVLDHVDRHHVVNPILIEKGIESMLGVPLLVSDEPIGVLHVGTLRRRRFGQDEIELLQLVAHRVALAVERARLHEQMVTFDEFQRSFVAVASHELRTPAAAVYGALVTVFERPGLPPETRNELLRTAYEQSDRLRRLLEQLLDLSRLDSGSIGVAPRRVVLGDALRNIAAGAAPNAPVILQIAEDAAAVIDPLTLDRVITNLLTNAVRHGAPPIVVAVEQRNRNLRIAVEDHGSGVPAHMLSDLFERFTRDRDAGGSGLGLAIARAYARAHGGDLVYEPGGAGARFELIVPQP